MDNGLFYDKYRIDSTRLPGYDYSKDGYYFITICTYEQEMFFGDVKNGEMILNDMGNIVASEWQKTEIIRPNIFLDEWVIMPNHLHGILKIDNGGVITDGGTNTNVNFLKYGGVETPRRGVSTDVARPTNANHTTNAANAGGHKLEWKPGVLGAIINQFKGKCTKQIRALQMCSIASMHMFNWQTRFYDHIIRDENSLNQIRQYIIENPEKWDRDRNNQKGLWM